MSDQPAERPTPETDSLVRRWNEAEGGDFSHIAVEQILDSHADLERELAEARELIAVKDRSINAANQTIMLNNEMIRQATDKLAEACRERDNAISDWKQADTDSIRAIHERNEARQQLENTIAERDQLKRDYDEARDGHWQTLELLKNVSEQRDRFSEALDYIRYNGMTMTKEAIVEVETHGIGGAE